MGKDYGYPFFGGSQIFTGDFGDRLRIFIIAPLQSGYVKHGRDNYDEDFPEYNRWNGTGCRDPWRHFADKWVSHSAPGTATLMNSFPVPVIIGEFDKAQLFSFVNLVSSQISKSVMAIAL